MTTVPANGQFGPDNFKVQTKSEYDRNLPGTVDAKFLKDINGNYIINAVTGLPYVVPQNYDPQQTISVFKSYGVLR